MVDNKRYDPTITRFQKHTKSFVSGKTKKGHLNKEERENGDVKKEEGVLIEIDKRKIYSNGWKVEVDGKKYNCTYGDNITYIPDSTLVQNTYKPKKKCKVEVSIDKKSKIYTITRIKGKDLMPITMDNDKIKLQGGGKASVTINQNKTEVSGDIVIDTSEEKGLPDEISVTELYKKVSEIELKLSDDNEL